MKKHLFLLFALTLLCGCNSKTPEEIVSTNDEIVTEEFSSNDIVLQEVENLEDAQITLPIGIVGNEIDGKNIIEQDSAASDDTSTNESDSASTQVTYSINGEDRTQIVNELSDEVKSTIDEIINNDELYPNVVKIIPSQDCTVFDIYFSSTDISLYESMLTLPIYMLGDKYQLYYGIPSEDVLTTLNYIDNSTGDIFYSGSSSEMSTD